MNWLYYLAEANAYLAVIYGVYYMVLRRETFYQLNRAYLLAGTTLAFIIPLLQLGVLRPAPEAMTVQIVPEGIGVATIAAPAEPSEDNYLLWAYSAIVGIMLALFVYKIIQLVLLARQGKRRSNDGYSLIEIDSADTPAFSFFNYLFISAHANGADTIIRHELVHIRQRHSWDVVYLEMFKIVNWFNPVVYLLQNSIKELHEYIADEQLGKNRQDINAYTDFLLSNAYGAFSTSLTNNFFHKNLLKKRIIMLHKQRSGYLARLKYLSILPVCAALLCCSTLAFAKTYNILDLMPQHDTSKLTKSPKLAVLQPSVKELPPPEPPKQTTSKGYKYQQTGYALKTGSDVRVIITEKDGTEHAYFKSKTNAATLKLLKNKYGYTFPGMQLYPKLPPPPPMAPVAAGKMEQAAPVQEVVSPKVIKEPTQGAKAKPVSLKLNPVKKEELIIIEEPLADTTYRTPEKIAEFPGGLSAFYSFLSKNVKYPEAARNARQQGKVFITFIVEKSGLLTNIKVVKGVSPEIDAEAVRVMKTSPNWIPGQQNNKPIRQLYTVPINFSLAAK